MPKKKETIIDVSTQKDIDAFKNLWKLPALEKQNAKDDGVRKFATGATRDTAKGKLDYEGFFSPLVMHRYAQYLHKHRVQSDGNLRDSDNWQNGITIETYMKSHIRHLMDIWLIYRGYEVYKERTPEGETTHVRVPSTDPIKSSWERVNIQDALCGDIFNSMGHLFELLMEE
jgi:hypothetical protein